MKLKTRHFGEIDINENNIIRFENGLPGFPNDKDLIVVTDDSDKDAPVCWLQSVNDGNTAFALLNVYSLMPNYNPKVEKEHVSSLGEIKDDSLVIYNIINIPEDMHKATVNLKAPVVINSKTKKGQQVILENDEYGIRHYIFDHSEK